MPGRVRPKMRSACRSIKVPNMHIITLVSFLALVATNLLTGCVHMPIPSPLDAKQFAGIDAAVESAIAGRQVPGAVFWLERKGASYQKAYGRYTFESASTAMSLDTVFDAASLTKVLATAPSVMLLIEDGKVALDAPLVRYLPECDGGGKEGISVRHLLTHTSGLAPGLPASPPWRGEAAALKLACEQAVTHPPGTLFRYSDINFILLGLLVQRVSGLPLNEFAARRLYRPLGMHHTGYLPLRTVAAAAIAPTQLMTGRSAQSLHGDLPDNQMLQGVVHDPTIRFMGGVGGSAGLFTTAADMARFARMMLNGGELDGVRVLSRESVRLMSSVQSPAGAEWRRSAGWDIDSPYSRPRGGVFPIGSYGHTGFTGCILWIDPFSGTFFILLSNRVYPDDRANILELYGRLGTLAAKSVTGFDFDNVADALPARVVPAGPPSGSRPPQPVSR